SFPFKVPGSPLIYTLSLHDALPIYPVESLEVLTDEDEPHSANDLSALVETGQEKNPEEYLLSQELQELIQRGLQELPLDQRIAVDRKSTRLNSSHQIISYAVFCLKK